MRRTQGKCDEIRRRSGACGPDDRSTGGACRGVGVDSRKLGPNELAQIGYVSENRLLPDWMPVRYFLAYCREFYPTWQDEDLAELIRVYELPLDRPLKSLSRG